MSSPAINSVPNLSYESFKECLDMFLTLDTIMSPKLVNDIWSRTYYPHLYSAYNDGTYYSHLWGKWLKRRSVLSFINSLDINCQQALIRWYRNYQKKHRK